MIAALTSVLAQAGDTPAPIATPEIVWSAMLPLLILAGGAVVLLTVSSLVPAVSRRSAMAGATVVIGAASLLACVPVWQRVQDPDRGPLSVVAGALGIDGFSVLATGVIAAVVILSALFLDGSCAAKTSTGPLHPRRLLVGDATRPDTTLIVPGCSGRGPALPLRSPGEPFYCDPRREVEIGTQTGMTVSHNKTLSFSGGVSWTSGGNLTGSLRSSQRYTNTSTIGWKRRQGRAFVCGNDDVPVDATRTRESVGYSIVTTTTWWMPSTTAPPPPPPCDPSCCC